MIKPKEILVIVCDVCHEELMYDLLYEDDERKLYPPILTQDDVPQYLEANYYRTVNGVLHCDGCWRVAPHEHEWQPYMATKEGSGNQCSRCRILEPGSQTPEFLAWQQQWSKDLAKAFSYKMELPNVVGGAS